MKKLSLAIIMLITATFCHAADNWLEDAFGKELVDAKGKKVAVETLKDKTIGIYFSAHWCPPCRQFTPQLVEFRDEVAKKKFEVVFVSFDKSKEAMEGYMTEMKMQWPAVPFKGEKAEALSEKYEIRGIPSLVILNSKGELITKDGRGDVTREGKKALKKWKK